MVCPPIRIARGIAFGVILGLIPKDNLTAVLLAAMTLFLPIHRLSTWICVLAVSLVYWWTDPWIGALGERVLSSAVIGSVLGALSDLPILAWCSLNNTVVLGGLLFGSITFALTSSGVQRVVQRIQHLRLQRQVDALILQAIVQSEGQPSIASSPISIVVQPPVEPETNGSDPLGEGRGSILRIDTRIDLPQPNLRPMEERKPASERQLGIFGASTELPPPPKHIGVRTSGQSTPEPLPVLPIGGLLQETRIEITRFRKEHHLGPANDHLSSMDPSLSSSISNPQEESETVHIVSANDHSMQSEPAYQIVRAVTGASKQNIEANDEESVESDIPSAPESREESLRFLLWHLSHREHRG